MNQLRKLYEKFDLSFLILLLSTSHKSVLKNVRDLLNHNKWPITHIESIDKIFCNETINGITELDLSEKGIDDNSLKQLSYTLHLFEKLQILNLSCILFLYILFFFLFFYFIYI